MIQQPPPQGQPVPQQQAGPPPVTIDAVMALLRNERMRGFRIDVETDSLVEADQNQEKANANELVAALGNFFKEFGPVVQAQPALAPMVSQLLCFALRRYKVGAELEETVEKAMNEVQQRLENPAPPQPSPDEQVKLETAKVKGQAEAQKAQMEGQIAQMEAQFRQQEMAMEAQFKQQEFAMDQQAQKMDMILKLLEHKQAVETHHMDAQQAERSHELSMEVAEHKAKEAKKPKTDG
jgi:lipopolysaccharide export system protein LptC